MLEAKFGHDPEGKLICRLVLRILHEGRIFQGGIEWLLQRILVKLPFVKLILSLLCYYEWRSPRMLFYC